MRVTEILGRVFVTGVFVTGVFLTSFSTEDAAGDAERAGCGLRLSGAEPAMRRRPEDTRAESLSRDAPVTGFQRSEGPERGPVDAAGRRDFRRSIMKSSTHHSNALRSTSEAGSQ